MSEVNLELSEGDLVHRNRKAAEMMEAEEKQTWHYASLKVFKGGLDEHPYFQVRDGDGKSCALMLERQIDGPEQLREELDELHEEYINAL